MRKVIYHYYPHWVASSISKVFLYLSPLFKVFVSKRPSEIPSLMDLQSLYVDNQCNICLSNPFETDDGSPPVRVYCCNKLFCSNCLRQWGSVQTEEGENGFKAGTCKSTSDTLYWYQFSCPACVQPIFTSPSHMPYKHTIIFTNTQQFIHNFEVYVMFIETSRLWDIQ